MSAQKQAAGAYDVRNVIAALIGFYGAVLVFVSIFGEDDAETPTTANLWAGVGMLVFAAAFALWSRLRPVVVDTHPEAPADREGT